MHLEAIVLAGGFGTRLQSVVSDVAKPMADICGKPFLDYLLSYLHHFDVNRVVLSVGYKKESIMSYFGASFDGMEIVYSVEDFPLRTGGAIKKAMSLTKDKNILVLNGDTFFAVDLSTFMIFHNDNSTLMSMALKPMTHYDRYGSVEISGDRILSFCEKGYKDNGLVNGGVYVLDRNIFDHFNVLPDAFSFENEFVEKFLDSILPLGFIDSGYFIDIGVPQDYEKAQKDLNDYFKNPS